MLLIEPDSAQRPRPGSPRAPVPPVPVHAFDADQARAASNRWIGQTAARDAKMHAVAQGRYDTAEPRERLQLRVERLMTKLPPAATESLAPTGAMPAAKELNPFLERLIGSTRDLLSIEFLDQGQRAARAVARIVTNLEDGSISYGTGFLVSPSLLLTNHHVLETERDAAASVAEFDYAHDVRHQTMTSQRFALDPDAFFLTDTDLDFSLVAVTPKSEMEAPLSTYPSLPLIGAEGKIIVGELVNIVQHPRGDLKQVVLREGKLVDIGARAADAFAYYEADTEPGSSGSPVFNDQWEVVALHHTSVPRTDPQGHFLGKDGNPWKEGDDPARLDWIANEGIRISRLLAFVDNAYAGLPAAKRALVDRLKAGSSDTTTTPPLPPEEPPESVRDRTNSEKNVGVHQKLVLGPVMGGTQTTITVPLQITISLGGAASPEPALPPTSPLSPPEVMTPSSATPPIIQENFKPDPDYDSRPGYNPGFLGFDLPMPALDNSVAAQAATLEDGSTELKYFHYSVILNKLRKIAFVSAVNVDVDAKAQIGREGADVWSFDPRIPKAMQTGATVYRNNPLDKGHLTRRQDGAWGATQAEAQSGNDDTFHWTNCSPQHETFNQSQKATAAGLLLWGNLENHVTEQAKLAHRKICVFNGPVFKKDDVAYRGVQLPRQFFKIIVMQGDDGTPNAVAFLLSQADLIADLPQENFSAGEFEPFQVKIASIEQMAKLDFRDLRKHDALNLEGAQERFESDVAIVHLRAPGDIVVHRKLG